MWFEEKLKSSSNINPKFGLCCQSGKVVLPLLPHSPDYLDGLLKDCLFKDNIRSLNSMFCLTSIGGKVDTSVLDGRGPPCFKISGENYHRIGSLLPSPGCMNSFAQLYICDAENEVRNRLRVLRDGDIDAGAIGKRIVLPSSFTGGPRNMMQHYQDSIAICRAIGPPDFFITFTCNPNWPEISRKLLNLPDQHTEDRPDIVPRIFRMKLKQLIEHFKEKRFFGNVLADKPITPEDFDEFICAEIPNKDADPLAYATVVRSIESYWRIHEFELQKHSPAVERLQYHLPNQQFVVFCEEDHLYNIVNREPSYKELGYEKTRTVNGIIYPTFKQACAARCLLDEDNEWHEALSEALTRASSVKLRNKFSTMLMFSEITNPVNLWERHWRAMVDDLQHRIRRDLTNSNMHLTDEELKDLALQEIECTLNRNGKSLADFPPMPQPSSRSFGHITNRLIREELEYDSIVEEQSFRTYFNGLNDDQLKVYNTIIEAY
ncbi:hypothetical protein Sango_1184700 [Sesamum angolense]|uniref:Helitron helicase-like domain-containing protein n=1 Tax=Sesamum angolense TaxID=2727404 RepID=A0AAE1WWM8_9LAMI|nr:hypothetical protein Sango_1184700 [Sesamum angolense]